MWLVGHRGIFLLDQSILFDGAWRIVQGQVPYRDFVSAFPPVAVFILSLFFRVMGVDFSAMVLAAAILNAVAAGCVMWTVYRLLHWQSVAAAAGLVTAVWFQAPFGTLWFEQTAFFFDLLALTVAVAAASRTHAPTLRVTAGVLLGIAMLSKQNAGVEFVPIVLGVVAIPHASSIRSAIAAVAQTAAGLALAFLAFGAWLWWFSSPAGFWHDYIVLARQIGADRIDVGKTAIGLVALTETWRLSILPLGVLLTALAVSYREGIRVPRMGLIVWIAVTCLYFQNAFKLHTDNELENCLPFLGLVYGLSVGLLYEVFWNRRAASSNKVELSPGTAFFIWLGVVLFGGLLYGGVQISWLRTIQQFVPNAHFEETLTVPGLTRVKWGEPTIIGQRSGARLDKRDFERLNQWLQASNTNFFVFPDSTMLYGLQGRVSPHPWLYFSPGHSFLRQDLPLVDATVVESLRRNNVRIIILEKDSWLGNERLIKEMPKLREWMENDFHRDAAFGIFEVWTLR